MAVSPKTTEDRKRVETVENPTNKTNEKQPALPKKKSQGKLNQDQAPTKAVRAGERQEKSNKLDGTKTEGNQKRPVKARRKKYPNPTPKLSISTTALQKLHLVAVAYSDVEREYFATQAAYEAEKEVEERAASVLEVMQAMGIPGKLYEADAYFLSNLLIDRPDLVLNLVDTLRGKDSLQTSVPGALELVDIPYTGADMRGLVIGNDRNMFKQLLVAAKIPTPPYQFIARPGTKIKPELGLPLIVKLNESGGSVGIDNRAVRETIKSAEQRVDQLIETYNIPVIVEKFVDGPEITAVVFEDSRKRHVFLGKKRFGFSPDGKHEFTSLESYSDPHSYTYEPVQDEGLVNTIETYVNKAFTILHNKDYAKYDIRVDEESCTPYFTDCNPNTAFGPRIGLPFTEVVETLYGLKFEKVLAALLSKYAKKIKRPH